MHIQNITPFRFYTQQTQTKNTINRNYADNTIKNNGVSFTARLFLSPKEFYDWKNNKTLMPKTMLQYLNEKPEERQNMPPALMLKLAFDDINDTENLEQVKRIFSGDRDEPLFHNLTDTPNKKPRTGILVELDVMKEDDKPLFKNGKDNLGHYILKKIYLEGKTLKEINTDFQKDISTYYKGLTPLNYEDIHAFGITFPKSGFWSSFTANRENFPYVFKPRKKSNETQSYNTSKTQSDNTSKPKQRENKFVIVKDWEIDKLSEILVKGNGNTQETKNQLKKSGVRDAEALNFVSKYIGEINSIVLEKLHISPDMKEYFENYDDLSKSQKAKFAEYMQQPDINKERSKTMKYMIKYFFLTYGADGNNDEFKELIEYAHNIKSKRLEALRLHEEIQKDYEEKLGIFDEIKPLEEIDNPEISEPQEIIKNTIKLADNVFVTGDIDIEYKNLLQMQTSLFPKSYAKKYIKFLEEQPMIDKDVKLSALLNQKEEELPPNLIPYSKDEVQKILYSTFTKFYDENRNDTKAAKQAFIDAVSNLHERLKDYTSFYAANIPVFLPFVHSLNECSKSENLKNNIDLIEKKYMEYRRPLTSSEINKISIALIQHLKNYKVTDKSILKGCDKYENVKTLLQSVATPVKNKNEHPFTPMKNLISDFLKTYGGTARVFIDKEHSQTELNAKFEEFFINLYEDNFAAIILYLKLNPSAMETLKTLDPQIYSEIKNFKG